MGTPTLAPNSTWFTQGGTSVKKSSITQIDIKDSYTPTGTVKSSWDASAAKDNSVKCYVEGTKLTIAGNGSGCIYANADSSQAFKGFTKMTLFNGVDIIDTSNATTFYQMFYDCSSLTALDLNSWDTHNVTNVYSTFNGMLALESLNVKDWNTEKVQTMRATFQCCVSLTNLDLSGWTTANVDSMRAMFGGVPDYGGDMKLTTITGIDGWDVSKVTNMEDMFYICRSLDNINVSNWDTSNVTTMKCLFYRCNSLTKLDVSKWDVSNVTTMEGLFRGCNSLTKLDVSNWDVSKVTTMTSMFGCGDDYGNTPMVIENLDVSRWNPASCTDMSFMFYGCKGPKEINVHNWDVSKVTTFDHMFAHSYLKVNGTRNWVTTAATNMNCMFHSVQNTVLDVTNFDTKNVQFFDQMFQSSGSLTKIIGLERFNTANGLGFGEMFQGCPNLRELNLSSFDTRKAKDGVTASGNGHKTATLANFFQNNYRLEKVTFGPNFSFSGDGTTTNTANHAALHAPSTEYISGADGKWYTQKRVARTPAEVKSNGAETYYASLYLANNVDFLIKNKSLMDMADNLRKVTGRTDDFTIDEFIDILGNSLVAGDAVKF